MCLSCEMHFVAFVSPTLSENWIPRILLSFIELEIQYITNTLHQQQDPQQQPLCIDKTLK